MTCVFEYFQSQCHILKKLHEFLHMMGAITIFGKNNCIFNIVNYGLVTKSLGGLDTHLRMWQRKQIVKR